MKYKRYTLKELATIKYGKNQAKVVTTEKKYPIYGTGGLMGYATQFLYDKPSVLIGRKGTIDKIRYVEHPFWTVDTLFYTEINTDLVIPEYFYYALSLVDLAKHNEGTTIPSLRTDTLNKIEFDIPDIEDQRRIIGILRPISDKIALNEKINNNLMQQARALFVSWFINFDPWNGVCPDEWSDGVLGDYVTIKRGGSPRPIQDYLSDTGYRWLKISDATAISSPFILSIKEHIKESGLSKTVFLRRGALVLSNSATPGIPKILDIDSCIHDGWLYFPESKFSNEYLYLFFKEIRSHLVSLGNGSVFTNLKTDILKNYPVRLPSDLVLKDFDAVVKPLFRMILHCTRENQHLCEVRDTLIPKFLSGVVDISEVSVD